ncbi:MAG: hypothetical protein HN341_14490 [Verrucomicrobia bacterium]|jgi:hypothetical protein|nr:hypothetical protein [Verrucomicrobiota bacterium]
MVSDRPIELDQCVRGLKSTGGGGWLGASPGVEQSDFRIIDEYVVFAVALPSYDETLTVFPLPFGRIAAALTFEDRDRAGRSWPHTHVLIASEYDYRKTIRGNPFVLVRNGLLHRQHVPSTELGTVTLDPSQADTEDKWPGGAAELLPDSGWEDAITCILEKRRVYLFTRDFPIEDRHRLFEALVLSLPVADRCTFYFATCMFSPREKPQNGQQVADTWEKETSRPVAASELAITLGLVPVEQLNDPAFERAFRDDRTGTVWDLEDGAFPEEHKGGMLYAQQAEALIRVSADGPAPLVAQVGEFLDSLGCDRTVAAELYTAIMDFGRELAVVDDDAFVSACECLVKHLRPGKVSAARLREILEDGFDRLVERTLNAENPESVDKFGDVFVMLTQARLCVDGLLPAAYSSALRGVTGTDGHAKHLRPLLEGTLGAVGAHETAYQILREALRKTNIPDQRFAALVSGEAVDENGLELAIWLRHFPEEFARHEDFPEAVVAWDKKVPSCIRNNIESVMGAIDAWEAAPSVPPPERRIECWKVVLGALSHRSSPQMATELHEAAIISYLDAVLQKRDSEELVVVETYLRALVDRYGGMVAELCEGVVKVLAGKAVSVRGIVSGDPGGGTFAAFLVMLYDVARSRRTAVMQQNLALVRKLGGNHRPHLLKHLFGHIWARYDRYGHASAGMGKLRVAQPHSLDDLTSCFRGLCKESTTEVAAKLAEELSESKLVDGERRQHMCGVLLAEYLVECNADAFVTFYRMAGKQGCKRGTLVKEAFEHSWRRRRSTKAVVDEIVDLLYVNRNTDYTLFIKALGKYQKKLIPGYARKDFHDDTSAGRTGWIPLGLIMIPLVAVIFTGYHMFFQTPQGGRAGSTQSSENVDKPKETSKNGSKTMDPGAAPPTGHQEGSSNGGRKTSSATQSTSDRSKKKSTNPSSPTEQRAGEFADPKQNVQAKPSTAKTDGRGAVPAPPLKVAPPGPAKGIASPRNAADPTGSHATSTRSPYSGTEKSKGNGAARNRDDVAAPEEADQGTLNRQLKIRLEHFRYLGSGESTTNVDFYLFSVKSSRDGWKELVFRVRDSKKEDKWTEKLQKWSPNSSVEERRIELGRRFYSIEAVHQKGAEKPMETEVILRVYRKRIDNCYYSLFPRRSHRDSRKKSTTYLLEYKHRHTDGKNSITHFLRKQGEDITLRGESDNTIILQIHDGSKSGIKLECIEGITYKGGSVRIGKAEQKH